MSINELVVIQLKILICLLRKILSDKRKLIPAVTHFDGTGRVQTVIKEYNIDFYFA